MRPDSPGAEWYQPPDEWWDDDPEPEPTPIEPLTIVAGVVTWTLTD